MHQTIHPSFRLTDCNMLPDTKKKKILLLKQLSQMFERRIHDPPARREIKLLDLIETERVNFGKKDLIGTERVNFGKKDEPP